MKNGGEEIANSVFGSLFLYFARFFKWDSDWEDYLDLRDDRRKKVLAAAYKQLFLNRITDAVKARVEAYKQMNTPRE